MNKKGFTLIELLAVIIILGILMIIAIPSVTKYINDSRKNSYIDTAKELISGARNMVNEGKLGMYATDTTYYIPSSCIKTENGGVAESPYGKFKQAYIGVIYNGQGYNYYWISVDDSGQGIPNITPLDKLDVDLIESDLKESDIENTVKHTGIGARSEIYILDCKKEEWETQIHLDDVTNNVSEDGDSSGLGSNANKTAAQIIGALPELVENADAKRYVGANPNNYVEFNGNELWRIIGVYGDKLKIIRSTGLSIQYPNNTYNKYVSSGNAWEGSDLQTFLNNEYYPSLSENTKLFIVESNWNVGEVEYDSSAIEAYNSAKTIKWTGKVGLITSYEFLFSSSNEYCWSIDSFSSYADYNIPGTTTKCREISALNFGSDKWTMNPSSGSSQKAIRLYARGFSYHNEVSNSYQILPVVYLNPSVKVISGTGTSSDPYILSL